MFRFILPFILIVFIGSMYFVYIQPGILRLSVINDEIQMVRNALDVQKKDVEFALKKLEEQWNNVNIKDKNKLHRLLQQGTEFDQVVFVNHINNIANEHNMILKNLKFANQSLDSVKEDYGEFTMTFAVESNYENFKAFLNNLERNEQIIEITDLSFQSTDQEYFTYKVSLVTYWLK